MFWGVRRSDGTIERWEAILHRPPLQVSLGMKKPPTARIVSAGSEFPIDIPEIVVVEVHSGPGAMFPDPPTAREYARAIEDEWLARHWDLAYKE